MSPSALEGDTVRAGSPHNSPQVGAPSMRNIPTVTRWMRKTAPQAASPESRAGFAAEEVVFKTETWSKDVFIPGFQVSAYDPEGAMSQETTRQGLLLHGHECTYENQDRRSGCSRRGSATEFKQNTLTDPAGPPQGSARPTARTTALQDSAARHTPKWTAWPVPEHPTDHRRAQSLRPGLSGRKSMHGPPRVSCDLHINMQTGKSRRDSESAHPLLGFEHLSLKNTELPP